MTTSTSPPTAIEWAHDHGRAFEFEVQIGASTDRIHRGRGWHYSHPDEKIGSGILIENAKAFPNAHEAFYSLDAPGAPEVTFWLCQAWHDERNDMLLRECAIPLGPGRCYHLQVVAP